MCLTPQFLNLLYQITTTTPAMFSDSTCHHLVVSVLGGGAYACRAGRGRGRGLGAASSSRFPHLAHVTCISHTQVTP